MFDLIPGYCYAQICKITWIFNHKFLTLSVSYFSFERWLILLVFLFSVEALLIYLRTENGFGCAVLLIWFVENCCLTKASTNFEIPRPQLGGILSGKNIRNTVISFWKSYWFVSGWREVALMLLKNHCFMHLKSFRSLKFVNRYFIWSFSLTTNQWCSESCL